jgi:hypothetical protein
MITPDAKSLLADLQRLLDRMEQRTAGTPPMGATCGSLELDSAALSPQYHVGHFSERHKLSPAEAWQAEQLLRKANHLRPIKGKHAQQRQARRIAGIVSAIRNGRVSSAHWGHSMLARRGGLVMAAHGAHILAANRARILEARWLAASENVPPR